MAPGISTLPASESSRGLIEQLLDEQQLLTPVADFARKHERGEIGGATANYRDLLPMTPLMRGEQYAFEVELDKCSGCKACVTACHSLNGLDDNETWRDVGLLVAAPRKRGDNRDQTLSHLRQSLAVSSSAVVAQHVTTACHHCVDPACLNGCPVLAYEKDSVTGIVRHLDDQCIGCQYCVLKCPYDVPKYNARLGIVRKCDMCANRLAVGEAPACAQACPNEAIRITKVSTSAVTIEFRERGKSFLSGAPAGEYTLPTTRYVGVTASRQSAANLSLLDEDRSASLCRDAPTLVAADAAALHPQPAHWPLVFMLVLSQASVGVVAIAALKQPAPLPLFLLSLGLVVMGLGASVFHLGRPLGAWRAFLNLKRSWMSREIVVFGMFLPMLAAAVALARGAPVSDPAWSLKLFRAGAETGAPIVGLLGVFCSMMIYHDTRRALWHWRRSAGLFFGTTALLGLSALFALQSSNGLILGALALAGTMKLAVEVSVLRHATDRDLTPLKKAALLVTGKFQPFAFARVVSLALASVGLPLLLHADAFGGDTSFVAWTAFALLLAGELLERLLFFRCVVAPKMPGGFHA